MEPDSSIATRVLASLVVAAVLASAVAGVAAASSADSTASSSTAPSISDSLLGGETIVSSLAVTTGTLENTTDSTTDDLENATNDSDDGGIESTVDETTDTVDETVTPVDETIDETIYTVDRLDGGTVVEGSVEATAETDDRNASTENDGSNGDESGAENASSDGSDDADSAETSGSTGAAADAVLVGILGAITASGAAAGGSGASGTAGSASTATANWLRRARDLRHLSGAGSVWKLLPVFRYSRYDDSDPLEHDRRRTIYETIRDGPGCYLSQVSDRTGVPLSTVRYHVRILEDEGLVTPIKRNGKRRYFLEAEDAELRAALAEPAKREVLETLATLGRAHNGRLADELDRDPSTVSHHLSALEDDELIVRERDGRSIVNELPPRVEAALIDEPAADEESPPAPADD